MSTTWESLALMPRWVGWQPEERDGRVTKVPHSPRGGRASSADPATWGTAAEARACAAKLPSPDANIGFQLGDLGNGIALGGLDLDSCRSTETGVIEPWAETLIRRLGSYAEVSPSGTGVKLFFHYDPAALPGLLRVMGSNGGRKWARGTGKHAPAVELYLTGRYFAVTGERLADSPADVRHVSAATLEGLIRHDGPAFAGAAPAATPSLPLPAQGSDGEVLARARLVPAAARLLGGDRTGLHDTTRSGLGMALGGALKRAGWSFDATVDALHAWGETAEWCAEKGDANGGRELRRLWDRIGTPEPRQHGEEFAADGGPAPVRRGLSFISPADLAGVEPPEREWIVPGWLPAGEVTAIYGPGGTGKSLLLQQLQTACGAGVPWLGVPVQQCPTLAIYCEDDDDELHRRQVAICRHLGVGKDALGAVRWRGRVGAENLLATGGDGAIQLTTFFEQLAASVRETGARVCIVDNIAQTFGGNENVRTEVTQFVNALGRIAKETGAAVILAGHPSARAGAEYSGSTAWDAAVRSRWIMGRPAPEDGEAEDPNARTLRRAKSNYAAVDDVIAFRWEAGAFVTTPGDEFGAADDAQGDDARFLHDLATLKAQGRVVSESRNSARWAPKLMRSMSRRRAVAAMERLFAQGVIEVGEAGRTTSRHPIMGIRLVSHQDTNSPAQGAALGLRSGCARVPAECADVRSGSSQAIDIASENAALGFDALGLRSGSENCARVPAKPLNSFALGLRSGAPGVSLYTTYISGAPDGARPGLAQEGKRAADALPPMPPLGNGNISPAEYAAMLS